MKRIWIWGSVVALALILLTFAFLHQRPSQTVDNSAPLRLAYVAAEGKVEAMPGFDVDVGTSELNGRIARILVKEGDPVSIGQTVAVLENEDLQAQVTQGEKELAVARARLTELESGARKEEILQADARLRGATARRDEARNQLQRQRDLRRQELIPQATVDAAEAALDYHRKRLDKTIIRSPINGTMIERYLDEGEGVTPEIPILAIADLNRLWLNVEVDETDIGRVHLGDTVQISSNAYPGQLYQGTVSEIADYAGARKIRPSNPTINLGLKVVQVKIGLAERTPLRLGMTVDVKIVPSGG